MPLVTIRDSVPSRQQIRDEKRVKHGGRLMLQAGSSFSVLVSFVLYYLKEFFNSQHVWSVVYCYLIHFPAHPSRVLLPLPTGCTATRSTS
jgi:hypothetical protein